MENCRVTITIQNGQIQCIQRRDQMDSNGDRFFERDSKIWLVGNCQSATLGSFWETRPTYDMHLRQVKIRDESWNRRSCFKSTMGTSNVRDGITRAPHLRLQQHLIQAACPAWVKGRAGLMRWTLRCNEVVFSQWCLCVKDVDQRNQSSSGKNYEWRWMKNVNMCLIPSQPHPNSILFLYISYLHNITTISKP